MTMPMPSVPRISADFHADSACFCAEMVQFAAATYERTVTS